MRLTLALYDCNFIDIHVPSYKYQQTFFAVLIEMTSDCSLHTAYDELEWKWCFVHSVRLYQFS